MSSSARQCFQRVRRPQARMAMIEGKTENKSNEILFAEKNPKLKIKINPLTEREAEPDRAAQTLDG